MNKIKCRNGHWYDADTYDACPHCVSAAESEEPDVTIVEMFGISQETAGKSDDGRGLVSEPDDTAVMDSDAKTVGYFSALTARGENRGSAASCFVQEPVTGWLACTGGPHMGTCFELFSGNNPIGRSRDNRICLDRDHGVSRNRHAIVIYEPRNRKFYLQPGSVSGLTYLNGAFVPEIRELSSMDRIEVGDTQLLFVPLCGAEFSWDECCGTERRDG